MGAWAVWTAAAAVLAVAEMLTLGLILAPFVLGAVLAAVLAAIGVCFPVSLAALAVVALVLLLVVRPRVLARWRVPIAIRTQAGALVGSRAEVVERVTSLHPGVVKLDGELWTARACDEHEVIEPGTIVHIIEIQGATALVAEKEQSAAAWLVAFAAREIAPSSAE
jgi:membrane protein implicated in regulation of membrane protease activity